MSYLKNGCGGHCPPNFECGLDRGVEYCFGAVPAAHFFPTPLALKVLYIAIVVVVVGSIVTACWKWSQPIGAAAHRIRRGISSLFQEEERERNYMPSTVDPSQLVSIKVDADTNEMLKATGTVPEAELTESPLKKPTLVQIEK